MTRSVYKIYYAKQHFFLGGGCVASETVAGVSTTFGESLSTTLLGLAEKL